MYLFIFLFLINLFIYFVYLYIALFVYLDVLKPATNFCMVPEGFHWIKRRLALFSDFLMSCSSSSSQVCPGFGNSKLHPHALTILRVPRSLEWNAMKHSSWSLQNLTKTVCQCQLADIPCIVSDQLCVEEKKNHGGLVGHSSPCCVFFSLGSTVRYQLQKNKTKNIIPWSIFWGRTSSKISHWFTNRDPPHDAMAEEYIFDPTGLYDPAPGCTKELEVASHVAVHENMVKHLVRLEYYNPLWDILSTSGYCRISIASF